MNDADTDQTGADETGADETGARRVTGAVLTRDELKQLLVRNWMTHDAMWFVEAVNLVGIDTANRMNRAAVRNMATIEAKRLRRLLGSPAIRDLSDLRRFFELAAELVMGDFMDFSWEWSEPGDRVRFRFHTCFAHDGVSALGVVDRYECGIFERVYGWLDALGVEFAVEPDVAHCTMHHDGRCERELHCTFATAS